MALNKNQERFSQIQVLQPSGVAIASGQPLVFGESYTAVGVAIEAQVAYGTVPVPPYDSGTGFVSVDFEGVFNLSVHGSAQSSPSAGAAIKRFDPVFADGGTYDPVSGMTYGFTLNANAGATFFGLALDPVAAGSTTTIRVLLKNAAMQN
jgi:hypothetical protein